MIGIGFIVRILQFMLYVVVGVSLLAAVVFVVTWAVRLLIEFLQYHFSEQLTWLRSKLPKRKKSTKRKRITRETS